jgi:hypothetical protein
MHGLQKARRKCYAGVMKKLTIVGVAAALVLSSTLTFAGEVHHRQKRQHKRIEKGVRSGELTPEEAGKLKAEEADIQAKREKALADGKMTKKERRQIRHEQNQTGHEIRKDKHNSQYNP